MIESLEPRLNFANPTSAESIMLDLINRARANPVAELARFNMDVNEGLAPGTISTSPKSKLVWNSKLNDIARTQANYLMTNGLMTHQDANGDYFFERVIKAGIQAKYVDENAGVLLSFMTYNNPTYGATRLHDLFVTDTSLPGRGHRQQMLDWKMNQIGISVITGNWNGSTACVVVYDMIDTPTVPIRNIFSITEILHKDDSLIRDIL